MGGCFYETKRQGTGQKRRFINRLFMNARWCRIAMIDNAQAYIVPMNFGYDFQGETLSLYFHCANEGRKIDILRVSKDVCFEMDCAHKLIADNARLQVWLFLCKHYRQRKG